ncbi:MAG TPA: hypothetical protein VKT81_00420 [Bryobacteraceae bacterium]|nr:hypothetical protein [Bryobacteraceae bacterium]
MKHLLVKALIGSSLLLLGTTSFAQDRDRDRDDRYHQGDRDEGFWRGRLFERVRADLDHIQSNTPVFSGDEYRLVRVKEELGELQRKYEDHGYDSEKMEDVIAAMTRVVNDNHLAGRDREMLSDDLSRLRAFQEHHDGYR